MNPRPLGPEPSAIPSFATPRCQYIIDSFVKNVKEKFCACQADKILRLPGLIGGVDKTARA